MQRYKKSSNSQLGNVAIALCNCCKRTCKGTKKVAIHNHPDIKQLQKKIEISVNTYTGSNEEYWEAHKSVIDGKEYLVIEDYLGRKWRMDRETFDIHTTDRFKKRAERVKFMNEIASIAMDPDEVWLGRDAMSKKKVQLNLDNYFFVKHYKDVSLALRLYLKDDTFEFRS